MSDQKSPTDLRGLGGRSPRQGARPFVVTHPKMRSSSCHPFLGLDSPMPRSSRRTFRPVI